MTKTTVKVIYLFLCLEYTQLEEDRLKDWCNGPIIYYCSLSNSYIPVYLTYSDLHVSKQLINLYQYSLPSNSIYL